MQKKHKNIKCFYAGVKINYSVIFFSFVSDEQIPSKTFWALRHVISNFCSCFATAHGEDARKSIPSLCKTFPHIKVYDTDLCKFLTKTVSSLSTSLLHFSWTLGLILIYELRATQGNATQDYAYIFVLFFFINPWINNWHISWFVKNLTLSPRPGYFKTNLSCLVGFFFFLFPYLAKAFVFSLQKPKKYDKEEIEYMFLYALSVGAI